jgi:hypothetical protein
MRPEKMMQRTRRDRYWITSSAVANSVSGMARPSSLALGCLQVDDELDRVLRRDRDRRGRGLGRNRDDAVGCGEKCRRWGVSTTKNTRARCGRNNRRLRYAHLEQRPAASSRAAASFSMLRRRSDIVFFRQGTPAKPRESEAAWHAAKLASSRKAPAIHAEAGCFPCQQRRRRATQPK